AERRSRESVALRCRSLPRVTALARLCGSQVRSLRGPSGSLGKTGAFFFLSFSAERHFQQFDHHFDHHGIRRASSYPPSQVEPAPLPLGETPSGAIPRTVCAEAKCGNRPATETPQSPIDQQSRVAVAARSVEQAAPAHRIDGAPRRECPCERLAQPSFLRCA